MLLDGISLNWSDGEATDQFTRIISKADGFSGWVEIGTPMSQNCFFDQNIIQIAPDILPECAGLPNCNCPIIVNEFGTFGEDVSQYVELVVVGNGLCEGYENIAGCIVDDNNGSLIPPVSSTTEETIGQAGIDAGFLKFANTEQWQIVPNGSIIVIVEEDANFNDFDFDPYDSNQDQVYILKADQYDLLNGGTGNWNQSDLEMDYFGELINPTWDLIKLSEGGDGMQVVSVGLDINGFHTDICHAIAYGSSAYLEDGSYPIWIDGNLSIGSNCSFLEQNYFELSDFDCSTTLFPTPGVPNNPNNALWLNNISSCVDLGLLSGCVYIELNNDGIKDPNEVGIANIDVILTEEDGTIHTVVTDANGYYYAQVKVGTVNVLVDESDGDFPIGSFHTQGINPEDITVLLGPGNDAGNDGYIILSEVCGSLYYDIEGDGIRNQDDPGIPDVDILITGSGTNLTATTDIDGNWCALVFAGKL